MKEQPDISKVFYESDVAGIKSLPVFKILQTLSQGNI